MTAITLWFASLNTQSLQQILATRLYISFCVLSSSEEQANLIVFNDNSVPFFEGGKDYFSDLLMA